MSPSLKVRHAAVFHQISIMLAVLLQLSQHVYSVSQRQSSDRAKHAGVTLHCCNFSSFSREKRTTREAMLSGTRCDEYRKLVAGIYKKRHSYKEPLESSEFLQALDVRVTETGFALDIKEGQSRFAALDALRNQIWNVTKQADLRPLTGMRQGDGSWLLSAQTESQAEQESKKVKKLAKRGDIDFEAFYKEFLETDVEDWDKLPDRWTRS